MYTTKSESEKSVWRYFLPTITLSVASVGLIVTGFFVPPLGVIDGSVLSAVGELLGFAVIAEVPFCILVAKDKNITLKHGETEVNISGCGEED